MTGPRVTPFVPADRRQVEKLLCEMKAMNDTVLPYGLYDVLRAKGFDLSGFTRSMHLRT